MAISVDSTLSAFRAFGTKMGVTTHNVANVETEEFKKSRAVLEEGTRSDVQVDINRIDTPGSHIMTYASDGTMRETEMSNVDVGEELVESILTQRGYEANVSTIKTLDEVLGTIIDMKS